jgi:hypothetical protein
MSFYLNTRHGKVSLVFYSILCLCFLSSVQAGKPDKNKPSSNGYATVTLDNRVGNVQSWPNDVRESNDAIVCVGSLDQEGVGRTAILWRVTPSGSGYNVETHTLVDGEVATAINSQEEVVGESSVYDEASQLWLNVGLYWSDYTANPFVLPALEGDNETSATGLNAAGVIVGSSAFKYATYYPDGTVKEVFEASTAVAWRVVVVAGSTTIKGPYALGPQWGGARDINECNAGDIAQVVGNTDNGPGGWDVRCELDGSLTVLAGPYSLVPQDREGWGWASGINNNGEACGKAVGAVAFRTMSDGSFAELSTPRRGFSGARDINDAGQVVGQVIDPRKGEYGAMWNTDGSRIDLNSLLGRSSNWRRIWRATSITSNGIISATGALDTDGENGRALLMIPE